MTGRRVPATFIDGPLDGTTWQVPLLGEPGRPPEALTVHTGADHLTYSLDHGGPEAGWVYGFVA